MKKRNSSQEPAPIPPNMQLRAAPMTKPHRSKRAMIVKLVTMAFALFIVIIAIAVSTGSGGSKAAVAPVAATPPAGCLPASNDDGPFEAWLNNLAQAKFTSSARLVADGGTYLAARLDNDNKDVVVWWERTGSTPDAQNVYATDATTFTLSWLDKTNIVNSSSPGYAQVKLCLG